jgi:hypothetical protein
MKDGEDTEDALVGPHVIARENQHKDHERRQICRRLLLCRAFALNNRRYSRRDCLPVARALGLTLFSFQSPSIFNPVFPSVLIHGLLANLSYRSHEPLVIAVES